MEPLLKKEGRTHGRAVWGEWPIAHLFCSMAAVGGDAATPSDRSDQVGEKGGERGQEAVAMNPEIVREARLVIARFLRQAEVYDVIPDSAKARR